MDTLRTLNELLPNEQALHQAHHIQATLRTQLRETRDQISHLLHELNKDQSQERIQIVQSLIGELLLQTTRIKEKALESETIVREITRDIQTLDRGKKNLGESVTVLKRLGQLGTWSDGLNTGKRADTRSAEKALDHLDSTVPSKQYRDIAQALSVSSLPDHLPLGTLRLTLVLETERQGSIRFLQTICHHRLDRQTSKVGFGKAGGM